MNARPSPERSPGSRPTIRLEPRSFSMAEIGPPNPLPMVGAPPEIPYRITGDVPQEIIDGSQYGNPANLYPYQAQDGYDRVLSKRELHTVVLENDRLRAVFLPELGGRLWELFDRASGKHLLHTGTSIQLANLALRNAWFAGGIEWNIGTRGHSPTTCGPLHAGILRTPDGHEVLRMWEFDRLREVVFQVDAWLPAGSPVLLVAIRIRNPNATEVPMYWWSNAAVPEDARSRVIVPATSAFASDYGSGISRVTPTAENGTDCTWPTNNGRARDFFFDLARGRRKWIVNSDADGHGLAMLSTARLRGRKLFVWGQGAGARRWQDWLSPDGGRYAEIQAGLAQTQFQHLAMPAGAQWCWLEAYGDAGLDAGIAHGADWEAAVEHCEARIEALASPRLLEDSLAAAESWADLPPQRSIQLGTGWGALEAARRRAGGISWVNEAGTPFPAESITADQEPWLALLNGSGFPGAATFVRGEDWESRLESGDADAPTLLHTAVMKHARGESHAARTLYLEVLEQGATHSEGDESVPEEARQGRLEGPERLEGHPRTTAPFETGARAPSSGNEATLPEACAEEVAPRPSRSVPRRGRLEGSDASTGTQREHPSPRALAQRGLALIALAEGQRAEGIERYRLACALEPGNASLLIEAATALLAIGAAEAAQSLIERSELGHPKPGAARAGRVRFLHAQALAGAGHPERAATILRDGVEVADLREGEDSLSSLWQRVCPGESVPQGYQFGMG